MTNNLLLMFSNQDECKKDILFHTEDEIMAILTEESKTSQPCAFSFQQPLAIMWDIGENRHWFVGFYLDTNGDEDGTVRVITW